MNIYHLHRYEDPSSGYDEMNSCVVIARDETEAREVASRSAGDEGSDRWFTTVVTVRYLGTTAANESEFVCRDFHAG